MPIFNRDEYLRTMGRWRTSSRLLIWGGLLMLVLDEFFNFPTPAHGVLPLLWWLPVVTIGLAIRWRYNGLPFRVARALLEEHCFLTVTDLSQRLCVSPEDARRVMEYLVDKNQAVTDYGPDGARSGTDECFKIRLPSMVI